MAAIVIRSYLGMKSASWPALLGDSKKWLCVLKNTKAWMACCRGPVPCR
jgi:hypothetical protein